MEQEKFTLLLVDDVADVLDSLNRIFRDDYLVLTANSGKEAIELLKAHRIDLIISDQRMPDITGDAVLKFAMESQPEAIRILLTGYSDLESLVRCINEAGIYKYITKPWEPENLLLLVKFALEGLALHRQLDLATGIIRRNHYFPKQMLDQLKEVSIKRGEPVINIIHRAIKKELASKRI